MKAAVLYEPRKLVIEEVENPQAKDGEILIKVLYALTCGTDLKTYERGHTMIKYPMIIGHEYVGEVIENRSKNEKIKKGDIVVGANSAPCFNCYYCKKENYSLCEKLNESLLGFTKPGCFAEYMVIPQRISEINLFKLNDYDYKRYASLEPLACVVHGWKYLNVKDEDYVLIIGSGPIGILHALMAKLYTKNVYLLGKHKERLSLINELGINTFDYDEYYKNLHEIKNHYYFDVVIEAVGTNEAWNLAFELVRKGGFLLLFGGLGPNSKAIFDATKIHYGEIKILGSFHHDPNSIKKSFELIRDKVIPIDKLITSEVNLEKIEFALNNMAKGWDMKVGIKIA